MTKLEYLKYAFTNNLYTDISWYYTFFSILDYDNNDGRYLKLENGEIKVLVNNDYISIGKANINTPIYNMKDTITIDPTWILNIDNKVETTLGRYIANKILLERNFKNKIPYKNTQFSVKDIESDVGKQMRAGIISVDEYLSFVDCVAFMTNLSKITNVSSTPKSVLPPPGLKKKKSELKKEMEDKYGKDWVKDRAKLQEYQDKLKEFDKEWIKDDPSYGKLLSGKITNNSRVKMYLTFGGEVGFDKKSGKVTQVDNSLLDGYPKDKTQIAAMFNSSRSGSYDRGHETQKGGAAAKDILRSTSHITIMEGDCGSKKGFEINVKKNNADYLTGRYLLNGTLIENGKDYIGKTISIRSPIYCLSEHGNYCSVCAGDILSKNKSSISLRVLNLSSSLLSLSLKSLHNTQVTTIGYNLKNRIQ